MAVEMQTRFNVGGVELARPFKIRRLGHFGVNAYDVEKSLHFYRDVLGFKVSDTIDFGRILGEEAAGLGSGIGYFLHHGTDHHSHVIFPRRIYDAMGVKRSGRVVAPEVTINQLTWQVGSMQEVNDAIRWFNDTHKPVTRTGRDMPGSNWHMYMPDPDRHTNEMYYGIEQIGWDGYSKPLPMRERVFHETPTLPQISEFDEVQQALSKGVDLQSGYRDTEASPATYDVEGILLPRPFKVVKIGPIGLFVHDLRAAEDFYVNTLGFTVTERTTYQGSDCVFLRCNTEHHSLALYPIALRAQLGFWEGSSLATFGLQVANYRQLKDGVSFLKEQGCEVRELPTELHPGIDYAACVRDPDGHSVQLYYYMEQIGWDGQPRPASQRPQVRIGNWPEAVEPQADTFMGEPYLGPWG